MIGLDICLKALNHSYRIGLAFQKSSMQSIEILRSLSRSSKISTLLKSSVKISDVEFKYNGDLVINSLSILDHRRDTLIYIDRIVTSILTPTNILTSNTKLNSLYLSNGVIKINKYPGDSLTNYQIFFNKIKRDNSQNIENFSLNLKDLNFENFVEGKFRNIKTNYTN